MFIVVLIFQHFCSIIDSKKMNKARRHSKEDRYRGHDADGSTTKKRRKKMKKKEIKEESTNKKTKKKKNSCNHESETVSNAAQELALDDPTTTETEVHENITIKSKKKKHRNPTTTLDSTPSPHTAAAKATRRRKKKEGRSKKKETKRRKQVVDFEENRPCDMMTFRRSRETQIYCMEDESEEGYDWEETPSISDVPGAHHIGDGLSSDVILSTNSVDLEDQRTTSYTRGATPTRGMGRSGLGSSINEEGASNRTAQEENDRRSESNNYLVVAELAPETPEAVVATAVKTLPVWKKLLIGLFVVFVITVILTFAFLEKAEKETMAPSISMETSKAPEPSSVPTTMAPMSNLDKAMVLISDFLPEPPATEMQLQALEWVADNDAGLLLVQDAQGLLERFVLAVFFYSTDGEHWRFNNLWLSDTSICGWQRIFCDEHGRIEMIDQFFIISSNNLSGPIPTELGLLATLSRLDLGNNQMTGTIPTELGKLTALKSLSLDSNDLWGTIPTELDYLTLLKCLDLESNALSGVVPPELGQVLVPLDNKCCLGANQLTGIPDNCDRTACSCF